MATAKYNVVSLIPARKNSKGLPNKNFINFGTTSLFNQAIKVSLHCTLINETYISTDDEKMHSLGLDLGAKSTGIRNSNLAQDDSSVVDVAIDFLKRYQKSNNKQVDILVLLEPTSPMRTPSLVDTIIGRLLENYYKLDAVNSFGKLDFGIDSLFYLDNDIPHPIIADGDPKRLRQEQNALFFPFGIAYCIKAKVLLTEKTFYPKNLGSVLIDEDYCLEVDSKIDFDLAEFLFVKNRIKI